MQTPETVFIESTFSESLSRSCLAAFLFVSCRTVTESPNSRYTGLYTVYADANKLVFNFDPNTGLALLMKCLILNFIHIFGFSG